MEVDKINKVKEVKKSKPLERVVCGCGYEITVNNYEKHKKTKKHLDRIYVVKHPIVINFD